MNSSPMINASANPFGCSCTAYSIFNPNSLPSLNNSFKLKISLGVYIINISLIPASIKTDIG